MGWEYLWSLAVVAAVLCAVGYYKFVYFLSIGYGFAVAGIGVALVVLFHGQMAPVHYVQCALLAAYGARLSGFLLYREIKNAAYRKTLKEVTASEKDMPLPVKFCIWVSVTVLYVAQTSPVFFRQYNGGAAGFLPWVGCCISLLALVLESAADRQKSAQKAENPHMVATKGLYKLVRCPNYLGEILFWTGVLVGSLNILSGVGQWLTAILGYVCIVLIMFNGAQRLEKRQSARYGNDPAYRLYADKTPILIPFVPLYHLYKEEK